MYDRADAHIHLMEGGFRTKSLQRVPGATLDEPAYFDALMKDHAVKAALVVGFAGEECYAGNNAFLAAKVKQYDWINPTAYMRPHDVTVEALEGLAAQGFIGISLYIFDDDSIKALLAIDDGAWAWLVERRWLVSVNSTGKAWIAWQTVLQRHGDLRVLIAHLGLPPRATNPPAHDEVRVAMQSVLELAAYGGARVKLSGFYALSEPGHDYPHAAAWPYVQALVDAFGSHRLLWASDFFPAVDDLTYAQTYDLFGHMPFISDDDRRAIEGANLVQLLSEIQRG